MIEIVAFYKIAYDDYNKWEETDKKLFKRIKVTENTIYIVSCREHYK